MADNFDMKKFLVENKLGAYSKLKNEGEAAYEYEKGKAAGEKLAKEDLGKDLEDTEAAKQMDFLAEDETDPKAKKELDTIQKQIVAAQSKLKSFRKTYKDNYSKASKEKQKQLDAALKAAEKEFEKTVTPLEAQSKKLKENKESLNEDASVVMDVLGMLAGLAGMGLTGVQILRWQNKLEKENPELYKQLGKVNTTIGGADPSKNLEETNEEPLNEDASTVMDILGLLGGLAGIGLTGVQILKWQNKLEKENPELYKQLGKINTTIGAGDPSKNLEENKEEVKEALTPEMFERMDALTSTTAQRAMIKAAEIMMNELTKEGFEVLDIREYFTQLIANDI